ncbi:MAG: hypothetical protein Q8N04_04280 [Nitrospira sp.]|nr:hypothetical protein [Nitrospira sp.]
MHADGFNNVIGKMAARSRQTFPGGDWKRLGPLRLKFDGAFGHAEVKPNAFRVIDPAVGGSRGQLKELDWKWDRLAVRVGLDIPKVTVGGWCILPKPWGGCAIRLPEKNFFAQDPDFDVQFDFAGLRHEISTAFDVDVRKNAADKLYQLFLDPEMPLDVDLLDISDMVGDFLDRLVRTLVDKVFSFLPSAARSIVNAILGGIAKLVRKILDIGDDLMEWISEKIGISLGLFNLLASAILELFFKPEPIFEVEDPYPVLKAEGSEPSVTLDITNLSVLFDKGEQSMIVAIDI